MRPARTYPDQRDDVRLLVIDPAAPDGAALRETRTPALPQLLAPGDLLVVNDAATLPASLRGFDDAGRPVEARLIAARGGWREEAGASSPRREASPLRVSPCRLSYASPPCCSAPATGTRARKIARLRRSWRKARASVSARSAPRLARHATLSPRLVELRFEGDGVALDADALWAALYKEGRPVQYAHLAHELPLWAVQTVYATRPWAFEMPSAGRPLSWEILLALAPPRRPLGVAHPRRRAERHRRSGDRRRAALAGGVRNSGGDRARRRRDARTPAAAWWRSGRRWCARWRARPSSTSGHGAGLVRAGRGETDLRITPTFRPRVVDGILSGAHAAHETHFQLLAAFAGADLLAAAAAHADRAGFLTHELGDSMLVLPGALAQPLKNATSAP